MELSSEDALRLNVMLASRPQAIRINESTMTVHSLSEKGEAQVRLNPNCRDEQYLRKVRELLSGHVLGSPGGYPVYLKRWTRMGQMRDESLEQMLLLGEPEAVTAVVCAPGLIDELARRAWWIMETAEHARRMLANPRVVQGEMGPKLAAYLVEHLPFETEPDAMIETVRLVLQHGLLDEAQRHDLWRKAGRKNAYYVGFLAAVPDELPVEVAGRADAERLAPLLSPLAQAGNPYAQVLRKVLSSSGQAFLDTVATVLKKPATQEVVTITLDLLREYFAAIRPEGDPDQTIEALLEEAEHACTTGAHPQIAAVLERAPALAPEVRAARVLSGMGYGVARPALGGSTAIGSLMRRRLEPALGPVAEQIRILRGQRRDDEKAAMRTAKAPRTPRKG
jgi:hypothetical protein